VQSFRCRTLAPRLALADGDLERARALAAKLAAEFPRSARGPALLAEAHRRAGDVAAGRRAADDAIARAPAFAPAHAVRGRLLALDASRRAEALAALDRAVALGPHLGPKLAAERAALAQELSISGSGTR
jgi:tetratricopeptide (TPR) repeat protein